MYGACDKCQCQENPEIFEYAKYDFRSINTNIVNTAVYPVRSGLVCFGKLATYKQPITLLIDDCRYQVARSVCGGTRICRFWPSLAVRDSCRNS